MVDDEMNYLFPSFITHHLINHLTIIYHLISHLFSFYLANHYSDVSYFIKVPLVGVRWDEMVVNDDVRWDGKWDGKCDDEMVDEMMMLDEMINEIWSTTSSSISFHVSPFFLLVYQPLWYQVRNEMSWLSLSQITISSTIYQIIYHLIYHLICK